MIYKDFYPFYTSYANPLLYRGEKEQEEEFFLMKSYYPDTARKIQEKVEEECDLQDYEGSRLYDEYPDRFMLYHLGRKIVDEVKSEADMEAMSDGLLGDLVEVLLFHEISRRRCRRRRCRGDFYIRRLAAEVCKEVNPDIQVFEGRIASGDQFVCDQDVKNRIVSEFSAYATEMEGAAIGQAAYLNEIPFLVVRAISDKADGSAQMDYSEFEKAAVDHSVRLTLNMLARI